MKKIHVQILSFDRPAQLNLLLDSISEFDIQNRLLVTVQYCFSNEEYLIGYETLITRFPDIHFVKETRFFKPKITNPFIGAFWFNPVFWIRNKPFRNAFSNFKEVLLSSFNNMETEYCMFLTDDSLFFRDINIDEIILSELKNDSTVSYSLALGENIKEGLYNKGANHINWLFGNTKNGVAWDYPFSVDGRIYETKLIRQLINDILFTNPNTFETIMVLFNRVKKVFKKGYANSESCLVGFELNRVQQVYQNNNLGIDAIIMNDYYLKGYKLSIDFDRDCVDTFRPPINSISLYKEETVVLLYEANRAIHPKSNNI